MKGSIHQSALERLAATFRAGLFGMIYSLSKSHEKERWPEVFALALSGIQMLSVPLSGSKLFPWSSTPSVSPFSRSLDFITTDRLDETQGPVVYHVFLGISLSWTAIFLALALTVAVSFAKDIPQNALVLRSLRKIARRSASFLFLPFTAVLFRTIACPSTFSSWLDTGLACDSSERIVIAVFSTVLLAAFAFLAFFATATFVDRNPSSESWAAKGHGRVDIAMLSIKLLLMFFFNVVDEQLLGGAFVTIVVIASGIVWIGLFLRYMPYVHPHMNALEVGFGSTFLWCALALALSQLSGSEHTNDFSAFFLYFGGPVAFALGAAACLLRERAIAERDPETLTSVHEVEIWARAKLRKWRKASETDLAAGVPVRQLGRTQDSAAANVPASHPPVPAGASAAMCPVVSVSSSGAYGGSLSLRLLEEAEAVYRGAYDRFPHDSTLFIFAACFFREHSLLNYDEAIALSRAKKLDPAWDAQYHIYERTRQLREADKSGMSTVDRILFDQQVREAKTLRIDAFRQLMVVWETLGQPKPDGQRLQTAGVTLLRLLTRIEGLYTGLLRTNPNSTSVLRAYATHLMELANEPARAMEMLNKADRIEEANSKQRNRIMRHITFGTFTETQDLTDERSAIITISGDPSTLGEIVGVSTAACRTFGYASTQLVGQNINLIVPPPIRAAHNSFLHRFAKTGRATLINRSILVFGASKNGIIFPLWAQVTEAPPEEETCAPRFTAIMTPIMTSENHLIFGLKDAGFRVHAASSRSLSLLGLDAERIETNNISLLPWFPSLSSSFRTQSHSFSGSQAAALRTIPSAGELLNTEAVAVANEALRSARFQGGLTSAASSNSLRSADLNREIAVPIPPLLEAQSTSLIPLRNAADGTEFVLGSVQIITIRGMEPFGLLRWHPLPTEQSVADARRGGASDHDDDDDGAGSDVNSLDVASDSDGDLVDHILKRDDDDGGRGRGAGAGGGGRDTRATSTRGAGTGVDRPSVSGTGLFEVRRRTVNAAPSSNISFGGRESDHANPAAAEDGDEHPSSSGAASDQDATSLPGSALAVPVDEPAAAPEHGDDEARLLGDDALAAGSSRATVGTGAASTGAISTGEDAAAQSGAMVVSSPKLVIAGRRNSAQVAPEPPTPLVESSSPIIRGRGSARSDHFEPSSPSPGENSRLLMSPGGRSSGGGRGVGARGGGGGWGNGGGGGGGGGAAYGGASETYGGSRRDGGAVGSSIVNGTNGSYPGGSGVGGSRKIGGGGGGSRGAGYAGSVNSSGSKMTSQLKRSLASLRSATEPDVIVARKTIFGLVIAVIALLIGALVFVDHTSASAKRMMDGMWAAGRRLIAFQSAFSQLRTVTAVTAGLVMFGQGNLTMPILENFVLEVAEQNTFLTREGTSVGALSNAFDLKKTVQMVELTPNSTQWRNFTMSTFEATEMTAGTMLRLARGPLTVITGTQLDYVQIATNRGRVREAMNESHLWHTSDVREAMEDTQVILFAGSAVFLFFAIILSTLVFVRFINNISHRVEHISSPLLFIPAAQAKLLQRRWAVHLQRAVNEREGEDDGDSSTDEDIELNVEARGSAYDDDDDDDAEDRALVPSRGRRPSRGADSASIASPTRIPIRISADVRGGAGSGAGSSTPIRPMTSRPSGAGSGASGSAASAAGTGRPRRSFQQTHRGFLRGLAILTLPILFILGWLVFLVVLNVQLKNELFDASSRAALVQQLNSLVSRYVDDTAEVAIVSTPAARQATAAISIELDRQIVETARALVYGGTLDYGVGDAVLTTSELPTTSRIDGIVHEDACVDPTAKTTCLAVENGALGEGLYSGIMVALSIGRSLVSDLSQVQALGPQLDLPRLMMILRLRNIINPHTRAALRLAGELLFEEADAVVSELTTVMTTVSIVFVAGFVVFAFVYYWPMIDDLATPIRSAHGLLTIVPEEIIVSVPELKAALKDVISSSQLGALGAIEAE